MTEAKKTTLASIADQVRLRNATEADVPFIFNSWLRCFRNSPPTMGCPNPVYFAQHHKLLEGLCKRATIVVASNDKDLGQIYGYLCCEKIEGSLVVHFMYVKETFRELGIGRMLMETQGWTKETPIFYTHRSRICNQLESSFLMVYNPYLAYYGYDLAKDVVAPDGK